MNELPRSVNRPACVVLEKEASNLDSLVQNDSLVRLGDTVLREWERLDDFAEVERFGITPTKAAIFHGPPGNGKTMSAKMIASRLDCPLYRVTCEELLDPFLGGAEKNMANVMKWLESQDLCVVLFDECESIFRRRDAGDGGQCSQAIVKTMQTFWQLFDRHEAPTLFLMATNIVENVDPALLSRIELHIEFGRPTKEQAATVIEYWAEVLHEYGADVWAAALTRKVKRTAPASFRLLWQMIAASVREHIMST